MDKTEELIEWLEFQFSFKMTDVSKLSVKSKLKQYAQQVSRENVIDYAKFINPDGYKKDMVIYNLGRFNNEQI